HLAYRAGFHFTLFSKPLAMMLSKGLLEWAELLLTILWVVGVTNAINFTDGLDFLCAGTSLASYVSLCAIAILTERLALVPLYLVGITVLVGFGFYNRHPASIFLGDAGSTFLGYSLACFSIYQAKVGP